MPKTQESFDEITASSISSDLEDVVHYYPNNLSTSDIEGIYIKARGNEQERFGFAINYKSSGIKVYSLEDDTIPSCAQLDSFCKLLNLAKYEPTKRLSDELLMNITTELKGFISLNEDGIYEISEEATDAISPDSKWAVDHKSSEIFSEITCKTIPWYEFEDNISTVAKVAKQLLDSEVCKNARIFGLGQTPSWILKAAEHITKLDHVEREFGYIAFSGGFYELSNDEDDIPENAIYKQKHEINSDSLENYRKYLYEQKISPRHIIDKACDGTKTVITDITMTGKGLVSFLSILYNWAQKDGIIDSLKDSLIVLVLKDSERELSACKTLNFDDFTVDCNSILINNRAGNELLWVMANSPDQGQYSDRLVPYYPPSKWGSEPKPSSENSEFLTSLYEKVIVKVEMYLSEAVTEPDASGACGGVEVDPWEDMPELEEDAENLLIGASSDC